MADLPDAAVPWRLLPPDLGAALRPRLAATVEAVVAAVAAVPPFGPAADATGPAQAGEAAVKTGQDVREAVRVAVERFADLIGTGEPALPERERGVFAALGAAEAREDRGPEALLAALRAASRVLLRATSHALAAEREVGTAELVDLSDAVTAYVDELAAAATDGYARQVREQAGERDRRQGRLADLLLRGGAPAGVVRAAAADVGWRTPADVVPVIVPLDRARDARFRFAADGVVAERAGDAVVLLRAGPRTARTALAAALGDRPAVVGPAVPWPQVPEAVRLAELTARAAAGPAGPVGAAPVFVDDHLAALALRGEPGALDVLAARRLAPLADLRRTQRERLLVTLRSWLLHWGSRTEVAAELFVHPQTVSYRLKHLRALLGTDLDDPAARFELLLVLSRPDA